MKNSKKNFKKLTKRVKELEKRMLIFETVLLNCDCGCESDENPAEETENSEVTEN